MTLRSVLRAFREQVKETVSRGDSGQRRTASSGDSERLLHNCQTALEGHYDRTMHLHRFALATGRAVAMVAAGLLVAGFGASLLDASRVPSLVLIYAGALVAILALLTSAEGWSLGGQSRVILEKIVSLQYLALMLSTSSPLDEDAQARETAELNSHLRRLTELLHRSHERRGLWDLVTRWQEQRSKSTTDDYDLSDYGL